eukprot:scaffold958_cov128-Skeletonema_dohrnii-CCMP3373.AAC.11
MLPLWHRWSRQIGRWQSNDGVARSLIFSWTDWWGRVRSNGTPADSLWMYVAVSIGGYFPR